MQSWSQSEIERWYLWVHPIHNHISITYATQVTWKARVCAFIKKKLWLSHTQITKWEEWHASLMNAIIIIVIVIVIVLHSAAKVTNLLQFISDSCPVSYFHMIFTVFTQHIHDNCIWFSTALAWPGLAPLRDSVASGLSPRHGALSAADVSAVFPDCICLFTFWACSLSSALGLFSAVLAQSQPCPCPSVNSR